MKEAESEDIERACSDYKKKKNENKYGDNNNK